MVLPANIQYGGYGPLLSGTDSIVAQIVMNKVAMKTPTSVATTANVTIATGLNAGDTIDGVTLVAGDRVLVWQQTAASENGVYIVDASPFRAADFDEDAEIRGAFVPVQSGTTYGGNLFRNTNTAAITVDTDDITFELFASAGGGSPLIHDCGNLGATETMTIADGTVHRGTLDANCAITVSGFTVDEYGEMAIKLVQDGTGGWDVTWDSDIEWIGGNQPGQAAGDVTWFVLWSESGDATIYGAKVGGTSLAVDDGSTTVSNVESLTVTGAGGATATLVDDGGGAATLTVTQTGGDSAHAHINDVLFSGDASTTAFVLPVAPVDAYAVQAFVSGVLTEVTLSGALLTTATFGAAPASATNNVRFDIVAAID